MAKEDGGPAFPLQELNGDGSPATLVLGMTLRDYFAGQALAGLAANGELSDDMLKSQGISPDDYPIGISKAAYEFADAMIAERLK